MSGNKRIQNTLYVMQPVEVSSEIQISREAYNLLRGAKLEIPTINENVNNIVTTQEELKDESAAAKFRDEEIALCNHAIETHRDAIKLYEEGIEVYQKLMKDEEKSTDRRQAKIENYMNLIESLVEKKLKSATGIEEMEKRIANLNRYIQPALLKQEEKDESESNNNEETKEVQSETTEESTASETMTEEKQLENEQSEEEGELETYTEKQQINIPFPITCTFTLLLMIYGLQVLLSVCKFMQCDSKDNCMN